MWELKDYRVPSVDVVQEQLKEARRARLEWVLFQAKEVVVSRLTSKRLEQSRGWHRA